MSSRSVLAALRTLRRQPVALAALGTLVALVSGVVAVARIASTPAAVKPRVVSVPTATPVPGPTQTVTRTVTKTVVVTASPTASAHPSPATQLRCSSPQLSLTLTANKSHYAQGETVHFIATL